MVSLEHGVLYQAGDVSNIYLCVETHEGDLSTIQANGIPDRRGREIGILCFENSTPVELIESPFSPFALVGAVSRNGYGCWRKHRLEIRLPSDFETHYKPLPKGVDEKFLANLTHEMRCLESA